MPQSLRLALTASVGLLFLALVGAAAVSGGTPATQARVVHSSATSRVPADDAPNVLVFLTDDMRKDDLSYLPHVRDLLVDEGMTFTRRSRRTRCAARRGPS